jgi:hypothetical protein
MDFMVVKVGGFHNANKIPSNHWANEMGYVSKNAIRVSKIVLIVSKIKTVHFSF